MMYSKSHIKAVSFILSICILMCSFSLSACDRKNVEQQGNRVLLISIDGMRPDAAVNTEYGKQLMTQSTYTLAAQTVMPSITLPCHISMFYGVTPQTHGVLSNSDIYPENADCGITEILSSNGKKSALFFNWYLIDNTASNSDSVYRMFVDAADLGWERANLDTAEACIDYIANSPSDFTFLYLGFLDEWGHAYGWLSDEYYYALNESFALVDRVISSLPENYTVIITSDHGGHDNTHGTDMGEDMTIPIFIIGEDFAKGSVVSDASILDIAPTVLDILGVEKPDLWRGKSLHQDYE